MPEFPAPGHSTSRSACRPAASRSSPRTGPPPRWTSSPRTAVRVGRAGRRDPRRPARRHAHRRRAGSSGWRRRNGSVAVAIRVPLDGTVHVKAASADTACHGRFARVEVESARATPSPSTSPATPRSRRPAATSAPAGRGRPAGQGRVRRPHRPADRRLGQRQVGQRDVQVEELGRDADVKTARATSRSAGPRAACCG